MLQSGHFTGSKVDLWKAFDRSLVAAIATFAGFPLELARAYLQFMQALQFRNTLAVGLGEAHSKDLSISHGCPWSIAFLACVLRPWCIAVRSCNVGPRVLADDLRIFAQGEQHRSDLQGALAETSVYIASIEGKVSTGPGKSSIFYSDRLARGRLVCPCRPKVASARRSSRH